MYVATVSPNGTIMAINQFGSVPPEQLIGRQVTDLAPEADPAFTEALGSIRAGAEAARAEFPIPRAVGTRWVACHLVPVRVADRIEAITVVGVDVTSARQTGAELRMSVNALHRLLEDREMLAADLHDGILQSLYGVGLRLEAARAADPVSAATPQLDRAIAQLNETMADIRRFISASLSSLAINTEWEDALTGVLRGLDVAGGPQLQIELDRSAARRVNSADRGEVVFIAREAVSNAMRHAAARRIIVRLRGSSSGVRLEIEDDGQGFEPGGRYSGVGLLTMTRRAGRMGAIFSIESLPARGTLVRLDMNAPALTETDDSATSR